MDSFCGIGEGVNSCMVWKRQTLGMVWEESRQLESCHSWGQTLAMEYAGKWTLDVVKKETLAVVCWLFPCIRRELSIGMLAVTSRVL